MTIALSEKTEGAISAIKLPIPGRDTLSCSSISSLKIDDKRLSSIRKCYCTKLKKETNKYIIYFYCKIDTKDLQFYNFHITFAVPKREN